jgi:propionyl-CoA carboxylase beta chain
LLLREQGQMFAAGPAIVSALGEAVTKEELGGAEMHARSGSIDDIAENEEDAFWKARRFLSYLPPSIDSLPSRTPTVDPTTVPSRGSIRSFRAVDGTSIKCAAFSKRCSTRAAFRDRLQLGTLGNHGTRALDGWPVAVIASDPMIYGGAWTADTGQKLVRFVDLAETFHLPVVHLVDIPGLMVGVAAEQAGTVRHGARALASVYQATVPWCTVIVRKAFGIAGAATANHTRFPLPLRLAVGGLGLPPGRGRH